MEPQNVKVNNTEVSVVPINPKKTPCVVMVETGLSTRMGLRIMDGEMTMTFYEMIDGEITQISRVLSYPEWVKFATPSPL